MSRYRFSENKEYNAKVIREMISYFRASLSVVNLPNDELISIKDIEDFAEKVSEGRIQ